MLKELCEKIVVVGIDKGYLLKKQKDEYLYGMNMLFDISINIISLIIIGIIFKSLWECILFCFTYRYIRKYTGGFHLESPVNCYISSCFMYVLFISILKYLPFLMHETMSLVILSLIILWFISPIEAKNKPLEELEKKIYKKKARINIIIFLGIYIISYVIDTSILEILSYTIIFVMFFAILEIVKNKIIEEV